METFSEILKAHIEGRLQEAEWAYQALLANGEDENLVYHYAMTLYQQGKLKPLHGYLRQKIPEYAGSARLNALFGTVLGIMADFQRASDFGKNAVVISPRDAVLWNNLATIYIRSGNYLESLKAAEAALSLEPNYVHALLNKAICNVKMSEYKKAIDAYLAALAIEPTNIPARLNLAAAYAQFGEPQKAATNFKQVVKFKYPNRSPKERVDKFVDRLLDLVAVPQIYEHEREILITRTEIEKLLSELPTLLAHLTKEEKIQNKELFIFCFLKISNFYWAYQGKNDLVINQSYSALIKDALPDIVDYNPTDSSATKSLGLRRLRIGVLSEYFGLHATRWIGNLLFPRAGKDFDLIYFPVNETYDQAYLKEIEKFVSITPIRLTEKTLSDDFQTIRASKLDVLIFPDIGMTPSSRMFAAYRHARWQIAHWAHPVTSGSPCIDYFLTSSLMEPPNADSHYSESLLKLPGIGLYLKHPEIFSIKTPQKRTTGDNFRIASIQSLQKYLPQYDAVFVRIAKKRPNTCFFFLKHTSEKITEIFYRRIKAAFVSSKLDPERQIVMLDRMEKTRYAECLSSFDLIIDSIGWSGGNTTLDAIEAGCPVITVPGSYMRSRHTAAFLSTIGLQELICEDDEQLVEKILLLIDDPAHLDNLRQTLIDNRRLLYERGDVLEELISFIRTLSK